jgi:hypothetical protein
VLPQELDEARSLAAEAIDITKAPEQATFKYAVIAVQGATANALASLVNGGVAATVGMPPDEVPSSIQLKQIMHHDDPVALQKIADAAAAGKLTIPVASVFTLDDLGNTHQELANGPAARSSCVTNGRNREAS